jgi:hypothetical protein
LSLGIIVLLDERPKTEEAGATRSTQTLEPRTTFNPVIGEAEAFSNDERISRGDDGIEDSVLYEKPKTKANKSVTEKDRILLSNILYKLF